MTSRWMICVGATIDKLNLPDPVIRPLVGYQPFASYAAEDFSCQIEATVVKVRGLRPPSTVILPAKKKLQNPLANPFDHPVTP